MKHSIELLKSELNEFYIANAITENELSGDMINKFIYLYRAKFNLMYSELNKIESDINTLLKGCDNDGKQKS